MHCLPCSSGKTSTNARHVRRSLRTCCDHRPFDWGWVYLKCDVEVVLLYQSAHRWCGVALLFIFFFLDLPDRDISKLPLAKKMVQLDAPGTAILVPGVVCLLLVLQWGGQTYAVSYPYHLLGFTVH